MAKAKVLVTGGAGFAGFHICEHILHNTDWEVVVLDRLTYAGSLERLAETKAEFPSRLSFVYHDFRGPYPPSVISKLKGTQYIIHNGGETHVDRSLKNPLPFIQSNVQGTMATLEAARLLEVLRFIYVSTDEVHGPAPHGVDFKEDAPIKPSNPYSASKAGGEALAYAWFKSHGVPVTITRTMNLFGEKQHPEKFIPKVIKKVFADEMVDIHGIKYPWDISYTIGSRKWIHARNQADGLLFLLTRLASGETYHIAGEEHTNLEVARIVAGVLGKELRYRFVDSDRPGHDLRYSLDDSKLRALGWKPPVPFASSLERTVTWMTRPENLHWLHE